MRRPMRATMRSPGWAPSFSAAPWLSTTRVGRSGCGRPASSGSPAALGIISTLRAVAAAAEVGGGGDLPGARHGEGDVRACGQGGDVLGTVAGAADWNDLAHRRRALQPLGEGADQAVLEAEQHQKRVITAARAKIAQSDRRASPR